MKFVKKYHYRTKQNLLCPNLLFCLFTINVNSSLFFYFTTPCTAQVII